MAVVETFKGRCSPWTGAPVIVELLRLFNPSTLQDEWGIRFRSGNTMEEYNKLSPNQARTRFEYACKWWA